MSLFEPPDPVTSAFQARKTEIRRRALAGALALWDQLVYGPDDDTATDWVSAWAPQRAAGASAVAALTDAYVDAFLNAHGVTPATTAPLDLDSIVAKVRPGVSDVDIAMRPVKEVRYALADGSPLEQALQQGRQRLESIESTDIQQAFRVAFQERATQEPAINSYRRVLHGSENCAICVVATTQRYWTDRLMPIHPGCDCGVQPIIGPAGKIVDRARLNQVKDLLEAEGVTYGDRAEMANTKIRINVSDVDDVTEVPHGELGPILAVSKHRNTEMTDLPAWVRRSRREFAPGGQQTRGGQPRPRLP